jgi:hypothetical protein
MAFSLALGRAGLRWRQPVVLYNDPGNIVDCTEPAQYIFLSRLMANTLVPEPEIQFPSIGL